MTITITPTRRSRTVGLSIIREQLRNGDAMTENSGARVVRERTELQVPVPAPRPRLSGIEVAVALASQDTTELLVVHRRPEALPIQRQSIEPSTVRIITGLANRRRPAHVR